MAVTVTGKGVFAITAFTGVQTFSPGSLSHVAGRRIWVAAAAQEDFHTADFSWAVSDDASTNSITWTSAGTSSKDDTSGANLSTQVQVWYSSELTDNESFTITVDPNDGSSNTYYGAMLVWETEGNDGTLEQSIVFDIDTSGTNSNTANFGSSPSLTQVAACFTNDPASTCDWDAAPTNWSKVANCEADGDQGTGDGVEALLITSTTNTATGVTQTMSSPSGDTWFWMVLMEYAEEAKTGSGSSSLAVTASAAGQKHAYGAASASLAFTAATSKAKLYRDAAASLSVSAAGSGKKTAYGSGSTSLAVTVAGSGRKQTGASTSLAVSAAGTGHGETRGINLLQQGEEALFNGTWALDTASSLRLYTNDPSKGISPAARNALTESDFTEATFGGYSAPALTSGNWTITPGSPTTAEHTSVSITRSADALPDDTNLVRWWDAADAADASDQLLPDRDGTGADAQLGSTTGSDSEDPTITIGDPDTYNRIDPDGSDDYIELDYTPSFTATTGEFTAVYLGYWSSTDATEAFNRLLSFEDSSNDGCQMNTSNFGVASPSVLVGGASMATGGSAGSSLSDGDLFVAAMVVDDGNLYAYEYSVGLGSPVDITGVGTITFGAGRVFAESYANSQNANSGAVAVLLFEASLSESELDTLAEYLLGGYSLAESITGYYVTRDSDGLAMYYEKFLNGPYKVTASGDDVTFNPTAALGSS